jgi:hypothetical protein
MVNLAGVSVCYTTQSMNRGHITVHRINPNGTFDSICTLCFQTIATRERELDLVEDEKDHICVPGFLNLVEVKP